MGPEQHRPFALMALLAVITLRSQGCRSQEKTHREGHLSAGQPTVELLFAYNMIIAYLVLSQSRCYIIGVGLGQDGVGAPFRNISAG